MNNTYDLMTIYGIPPAPYSEDNPDDLFLKNLPSLEQIASFNLGNAQAMPQNNNNMSMQGNQTISNTGNNVSTPATTLGYMPYEQNMIGSASSESSNISQLITDYSKPFPVTAESIQYLNGFIRTQIGRRAQIQFLMGNAELVEKDGFLLGVGANYILINHRINFLL